MLVPVEWLKDYIDLDVSTEEFCDRMIMSGSNLETCQVLGEVRSESINFCGVIVRIRQPNQVGEHVWLSDASLALSILLWI